MGIAHINGAKLWYDVSGAGEPLLLHHGYTASRVNWQPITDRLQDRYQVIMMECRGTGESEHTVDGYNLAQYAEDVVGMLDHLGINKVSFAGHSMGGGIGYTLGLQHAERLENLILMAPIPARGTANLPNEAMIQERLAARKRGDRNYFLKEMIAARFRNDVTDEWLESRVDHLLSVSEGHLLGGMETMFALDVEDQLCNLHTPTLMIAGAVDGLLEANLRDYALLPDASLHVLSRAGHDVAVHEPDAVAEAIDQFLIHGPITAAKVMAMAAAAMAPNMASKK
jgi:pimeloyl-ACP methyl ester carboxylesterase